MKKSIRKKNYIKLLDYIDYIKIIDADENLPCFEESRIKETNIIS